MWHAEHNMGKSELESEALSRLLCGNSVGNFNFNCVKIQACLPFPLAMPLFLTKKLKKIKKKNQSEACLLH